MRRPEIAIVGIAETKPARRISSSVKSLVIDCILNALEDAGLTAADVDGIVTDGGIMPMTVPHDYVAGQLGIETSFNASVSYGGAGIVCAPLLAKMAIESGQASVVISYFGIDWGSNISGTYSFHDRYPAKGVFEKPYGYSAQPLYFSHIAKRYIHEYGLTESQLASVAINHRHHAILNGNAQLNKPLDNNDYLASRMIADPLRVADCCLISDGAGAFVMTSSDRAKDCRKRPVYVKGVGFASSSLTGDSAFTQNPNYLETLGASQASLRAQKMAGIGIAEIDFAQIYDCFTISCLMELEDLGFCKKGEGGAFFESGNARIGGSLPVNTHGGLLSYSYRLGIEHVTESVRQLRGEADASQVADSKIGLVSGFSIPDYGVLILGNESV
jgi:acetyl-CoA acetyltransferase